METLTATGFAYWASYLINGDASGLDDNERACADAFAEYLTGGKGSIVDCGEDTFFAYPECGSHLWGDCVEYTALVRP